MLRSHLSLWFLPIPHSNTRFVMSLSMLPECFPRVSLLLNLPLDLHTVSFSRTKVEFISVSLDNESEIQCILYHNTYWILLQIIISSGVQSVLLLMHIKQARSPERWNSCFCSVSSPLPWLFFILMLYFPLKYLQFSPTMCVAKKRNITERGLLLFSDSLLNG